MRTAAVGHPSCHPQLIGRQTDEILSHFGALLPDVIHAYVVVNESCVSGWMQHGDQRRPVGDIRIASQPIRRWTRGTRPHVGVQPRDTRQAAALGGCGIAALRMASVGIVGLGGAGSQVAEMLAHAGVGRLVMADGDRLEDVNLSRTHGSSPRLLGLHKVASMRRLVRRVSPETKVTVIAEHFPTVATIRHLRDVDVLVVCVDNPYARDEANRFALRYAIPLLDVGTTITEKPLAIDGHLSLVLPGSRCLRCLGHVSDAILEEWHNEERAGKYGLQEGRPQVVSFNGLLASAAVTEVLKLVTGFAGPSSSSAEWHYRAMSGELRPVAFADSRCRDCSWYALKADAA